jgi:glycosyltransferase involved in cell wall biosynthesis
MISFIVIGKNEGWKLKLCFESILSTIKHCNALDSEIIYVDSKSTDNSIDIAKSYLGIKVFQITGVCNAAIARNIGAIEAIGDILVFLDGDMEIEKEFLAEVIVDKNLVYPFISGQLQNIFYNNNLEWKVIDTNLLHHNLINDKYFTTTGGYFIIEKTVWKSIGGMRTKYKTAEDLDLGLRLARRGLKLLRKKDLMVRHHTIDYKNNDRMWKMLLDGSYNYQNSVLYRDHVFNKYLYQLMFRRDYTAFIFILVIFLSFINPLLLFIYFFLLFIRVFLQQKTTKNFSKFNVYIFYVIKDLIFLPNVLLFFPRLIKLKYSEK